jgi:hypothetical protein
LVALIGAFSDALRVSPFSAFLVLPIIAKEVLGTISGAAGIQSALRSFDYYAAAINRSVTDSPDTANSTSDLVDGMVVRDKYCWALTSSA